MLVAAERSLRPLEYRLESPSVDRGEACPFCPEATDATPTPRIGYPDDRRWLARVVPNRYPAVGQSQGRHLVFIESPRHVVCWSELTSDERRQALLAYQDQFRQCLDSGLSYGQIFKNCGPDAGASIEHCHSQLLASGRVPARVAAEVRGAEQYRNEHGECFFCQIAGQRQQTVAGTEDLVAVCPEFSRFPYETWILPRRHQSRFEQMSSRAGETGQPDMLDQLGHLLARVVRALREVIPEVAYNWLLHTSPGSSGSNGCAEAYHWHIELFPRLARLAGYELATGHYINVVDPRDAARELSGRASADHVESGATRPSRPRAKNGTDYSD